MPLVIVLLVGALGFCIIGASNDSRDAADRRMKEANNMSERYPKYNDYYKVISKDEYITIQELNNYKDMIIFGGEENVEQD